MITKVHQKGVKYYTPWTKVASLASCSNSLSAQKKKKLDTFMEDLALFTFVRLLHACKRYNFILFA